MKKKTATLIWLFYVLLMFQGCGYHSPYTKSMDENGPAATIHVSVWDNRTNEMGLENLIFQATADRLREIGALDITGDKERADYILSGTVLGVDYPASSFHTTNTAVTLSARIKVEYRLTDRVSGKKVWHTTEVIQGNSYSAGTYLPDGTFVTAGTKAIRSQSSKKTTLEAIAAEVSEHIYLRITDTLTNMSQ